MRGISNQKLVSAVTALALLLGSVGPPVQKACAGMTSMAPAQETCAHHDETSGDSKCPRADHGIEGGDAIALATMDCCGEAVWAEGEALLPTRLGGAPLDGRSVRSVRAPVWPEIASPTAIRSHRAPLISARGHLFLRHDAFLE